MINRPVSHGKPKRSACRLRSTRSARMGQRHRCVRRSQFFNENAVVGPFIAKLTKIHEDGDAVLERVRALTSELALLKQMISENNDRVRSCLHTGHVLALNPKSLKDRIDQAWGDDFLEIYRDSFGFFKSSPFEHLSNSDVLDSLRVFLALDEFGGFAATILTYNPDLLLLAYDRDHFWSGEKSNLSSDGVRRGDYTRILFEWSAISMGSFAPADISETMQSDHVSIKYTDHGTTYNLAPRLIGKGRYDFSILAKINEAIAQRGNEVQFETIISQKMFHDAMVVALTPTQKQNLIDLERYWEFMNWSS